ncbi:hypothetical protein ILUMI_02006 [Ignelater luminosus]|uniref:DDE-1 domain-containing protein n=1 Tax=Ignelater luminosus TaxID=2038154 RepID=A0A8K0GJP1_IGNLU|nr:hypothetical protein ILUMI_02006 [Ignelater luminosus]
MKKFLPLLVNLVIATLSKATEKALQVKTCRMGDYPNTGYSSTPKGWMTLDVFSNWFENQFLKFIGNCKPIMLLFDGHTSHITPELMKFGLDYCQKQFSSSANETENYEEHSSDSDMDVSDEKLLSVSDSEGFREGFREGIKSTIRKTPNRIQLLQQQMNEGSTTTKADQKG